MNSKAISGSDWTYLILLRKLVLAVLIIITEDTAPGWGCKDMHTRQGANSALQRFIHKNSLHKKTTIKFMTMTMMKLNFKAGGEEMTGANKSTPSDSLIYILPPTQKL